MNILDQKLAEIKKTKKIGLMAHVVIGYPSLSETISIVKTMEQSGVDFVELQIPFSDPIADGPTIMRACEKSLENGTKVKDSFDVMEKLSAEVSVPLLFMAYYNTVFKYGVEKFCRDAGAAGASGLIVPDMPIDEESEEHFYKFCKKYNLHAIHVVSPASTDERLRKNAKMASGFIYATARQGTTDAKKGLDPEIATFLKRVKKHFSIPLAVGFGISSKERVDAISDYADVAIIGSAVIDLVNNSEENKINDNIKRFFAELMVQ
jgi:tryptophan synthase alpha subunit